MPLDDIWAEVDKDQNGSLDKDEVPEFLNRVAEVINTERKGNYEQGKFDDLF